MLTACQSGPYPVSSPYYRIPAGSRLIVNQAVTIPPNQARVYIQYGKVISPREKKQYYAHCWFLSRQVLTEAQVIRPDTFVITEIKKYEDIVSDSTPIQLASLAGMRVDSGAAIMAIEYSTVLSLESKTQPDIIRFVCNHWEDPLDAKHLTVAEMQKTLGDIATIELATP